MEEFKGDKRTKAYKEWKLKFEKEQESKSKGLGDSLKKVAEATGIKAVVEAITDDCGCSERAERLNKLLPYKVKVVECLTEDEYSYLSDFFNDDKNYRIDSSTQSRMLKIYNRVFNQNQQRSNCDSCVRKIVSKLKELIKNY